MADKKIHTSQIVSKDESRVLPLLIAGFICFIVALLIGYGSWSVFGSQARERGVTSRFLSKFGLDSLITAKNKTNNNPNKPIIQKPEVNKEEKPVTNSNSISETQTSPEITGVVDVQGGEFAVGGGETQRPLQRVIVESFSIAETEVTNEQYSEFIKDTGHRSPIGWDGSNFPKGTENYPVVNVSWSDANAFCEWLSEKYQVKVRLPNQAEWELAARGSNRFVYPWGNEWNDEAVEPNKSERANPVKSFPLNKSPFGAYDMLGNVWEWTSEKISRKEMESEVTKQVTTKNEDVYLVLGGSFIEDRRKLRNTFWAELDADTRAKSLGFRYVIITNESTQN